MARYITHQLQPASGTQQVLLDLRRETGCICAKLVVVRVLPLCRVQQDYPMFVNKLMKGWLADQKQQQMRQQ
jgi:hypothetical protein